MPAKFPTGRKAPATHTATALPSEATDKKAPAKTLSGAFAAALGARPQMPHPQPRAPADSGKPALKAGGPPVKNSKPGAPTVPRKGHR